ncbi:MAG: rhodanese-like domain-containing protein [Candidatus Methylomirabilia bacterium]
MRRYVKVLFGSILLIVMVAADAGPRAESGPAAPIEFIAAESVLDLQRAGRPLLIVDVRTREEFEAAHIRGAVSIPLRELDRRYREISRQELVVLY